MSNQSYRRDIIEYVESNGGVGAVDADTVAAEVGCSKDTVYRYWNQAGDDSGGQEPETPTDDTDDSDDLQDAQPSDDDGDTDDIQPDDLDADDDTDPDATDLDLSDDADARTYNCGDCGTEVEYLQKRCPECGEKLLWSRIEA